MTPKNNKITGLVKTILIVVVAFALPALAQTSYIDAISRNQSIGNSASNLVFVDNTNSRVAIGSSTPLSTLHVNGSGASWAGLFVSNNTQQIFHVNATSGNIGVGTQNATQKLTIQDGGVEQIYSDNILKIIGGAEMSSDTYIVRTYGKFAFVGKNVNTGTCSGYDIAGCELSILDASNPANPKNVSGYDFGSAKDLTVVGKYIYIVSPANTGLCPFPGVEVNGCEFRIFDISNISSPVFTGGVEAGSDVEDIEISGKYAFIGKDNASGICSGTDIAGCEFSIIDISDPANPRNVSGVELSSSVSDIEISGVYAYIAKNIMSGDCSGTDLGSCEFSIMDVSDPINPRNVSGLNFGGTILSVDVSGSYAFLGKTASGGTPCTASNTSTCEFIILNISNPSSIGHVSGLSRVNTNAVKVLNSRYAVLISVEGSGVCPGTGCEFSIMDISNLSNPKYAGGLNLSVDVNSIDIQGKYAYVTTSINSAGNEFLVIDLGGLDAPAASIGNIAADRVDVSDSMRVGNNLQAGSLNVGTLGVYSQGPVSIFSSASSSSLLSVVKSGTALFTVMDTGRVGVGNVTAPTHALTVMGGGNFTQNLTVSSQSGGFNISGITFYNQSNRAWCLRISGQGVLQALEGACGG